MSVGVTLINQAFNIAASSPVTVLARATATSVPISTQTTVVTLAAPTDVTENHYITQINCSGQVYGKFEVFFNSTLRFTGRGGMDSNVPFPFTFPVQVPLTEAVEVKVTHFQVGETPDFEVTIVGFTG
jgi:hypothetical protein